MKCRTSKAADFASPSRLLKAAPVSRSDNSQPPLDEYFNSLFTALGPQHWWPGKTPFEVIVGAILTQSTSWTNVETAFGIFAGRDCSRLRRSKK